MSNQRGYALIEWLLALTLGAIFIPIICSSFIHLNKCQTQRFEHCQRSTELAYITSTLRYELTHATHVTVSNPDTLTATSLDGSPLQLKFSGDKLKFKRGSGNFVDLNQQNPISLGTLQKIPPRTLVLTFKIQTPHHEATPLKTIWIDLKND